ncbi:drug/metabolite transporter (DMT)-like permease [Actinocorallia herbida]|uniref:Drug/metabolite transporter (DMT)-like permease n=1 Tax=Actinocorallia herbida TaxID=58109 RepID=A0A3N1CNS1_9ACTN|nr:DMT family transporter [Actinocorallia herbida]ROO82814.1 drug/metabolite transporter (DMT)-like permease [Actinocorallia herbida]
MRRNTDLGAGAGAATGMTLVGTMAAVSATVTAYPVLIGQALRYGVAAAVLLPLAARAAGAPPKGAREWALLVALAASGLAGFNYCLVEAVRTASPATVGAVLGCAPLVISVAGPLVQGRRPSRRLVGAALTVSAGAALASGFGGGGLRGLAYAVGALTGEVLFSLLAVPLLPRLGAVRLSAYSVALAVPLLAAAALVSGESFRAPTPAEGAALAYIGLVITVVAFLLWYRALGRLGADRAAPYGGLIAVSAAATTAVIGAGVPSAAEIAGCLLVAVGVTCAAIPPGGPFTLRRPAERDVRGMRWPISYTPSCFRWGRTPRRNTGS